MDEWQISTKMLGRILHWSASDYDGHALLHWLSFRDAIAFDMAGPSA